MSSLPTHKQERSVTSRNEGLNFTCYGPRPFLWIRLLLLTSKTGKKVGVYTIYSFGSYTYTICNFFMTTPTNDGL